MLPSNRTPQSEGKTAGRRDVATPASANRSLQHTFKNLRRHFDTIVRNMQAADPVTRVRYIRRTEKPLTLKDIIDLGVKADREIGIYFDTYQFDPQKNGYDKYTRGIRYTPFCLYSSDSRNFATNRNAGSTIGAAVSYPPGGRERYRIIAHYHPTQSAAALQIHNDMKAADDQIEMVVTQRSLVLFYKNAFCYNAKSGSHLDTRYEAHQADPVYLPRLRLEFDDCDTYLSRFDVNTPITLEALGLLDAAQKTLDERWQAIERAKLRTMLPVAASSSAQQADSNEEYSKGGLFDLFGTFSASSRSSTSTPDPSLDDSHANTLESSNK